MEVLVPGSHNDDLDEIKYLVVGRGKIFLSIVVDSTFLGLWLGVLHVFDLLTAQVADSGDLEWLTAKVLLGVSTITLIVLYIFWDLRTANKLLRRAHQSQTALEALPAADSPSERGRND
jgi:hypothetical protein